MTGCFLKQSTASQARTLGPFVDNTDFKTLETGLTIANTDVKLMKNGGASADKNSGGGTHRVNGEYSFTFDATDTDTVGELTVSIAAAGALVVKKTFFVLEELVYDAIFGAGADLEMQLAAGAITSGVFGADSITASAAATDFINEVRDAITGYAGSMDLDSNGRARLVDGTGPGEIDLSSGLVQLTTADKDDVADRTWDSLTANHTIAGSFGKAIGDGGAGPWTTGGGGSISDILKPVFNIPDIDLADTITQRISIDLTNMLDDLPTAAEITPGTLSIERRAQGATSWSAIVTDAAMSEAPGIIYYDEVFDSGAGYAAGDMLRFTFKNQKVTVSANDYEICDATGRTFQGTIRGLPVTDIISVAPNIPSTVDLSDKTYRFQLQLINGIDDLPSTSEQTAGTYSIDRSADGGASWAAVQTDQACSETAGIIYFEEVFNSGGGYSAGDLIRITFKSQAVVAGGNTVEISDGTNGRIFYTEVRAVGSSPSAIADAMWDEATAGHATAGSFGKAVSDILVDTAEIGAAGAGLTGLPAVTVGAMDPDVMTASAASSGFINEIRDAITGFAGALDTDSNGRVRLVDGVGAGEIDSASGRVQVTEAQVDQIVDEVWNEPRAGHTTAGSFGEGVPVQSLSTTAKAEVNTEVLDVLNTDLLVAGVTIAECLRRMGGQLGGVLSGAGTGTETVNDYQGSANTMVYSVDASGNRTSVTYN